MEEEADLEPKVLDAGVEVVVLVISCGGVALGRVLEEKRRDLKEKTKKKMVRWKKEKKRKEKRGRKTGENMGFGRG